MFPCSQAAIAEPRHQNSRPATSQHAASTGNATNTQSGVRLEVGKTSHLALRLQLYSHVFSIAKPLATINPSRAILLQRDNMKGWM